MRRYGLPATVALATLVLFGVSAALLVFDGRVNGADALRTGGLAAGSVVALYALWLNDRRRRVDESRQQLEGARTDLDRERIADERFARAVELLGHEADQVRVGALHALAALARSSPGHTQTVLDVLCSYLRRPFAHPRYADEGEWERDERNAADRELQVRLTAQRLVTDLLPEVGADAPAYDLDFTNATLEYFDLSGRRVGTLVARYARLFHDNNLSRCDVIGPVWMTGASTHAGGRFRCRDAVFRSRAQFAGVEFGGPVWFDRSVFHGVADFHGAALHSEVSFADCRFEDVAKFADVTCADTDLAALLEEAAVPPTHG
ncbi:pentapeptide repeat-containing protein [Saccharopolyspora sp. NFXS83]|uniref:pentapeptide repeat-containing protein n=1 Tax=Saccharopolyspora sp. NFXS83 TaxID=2993560 RepID=UPI00224B6521|nr:pentapeptide repeat-containing protein [Saccharopolyspora sp. NFXS83]MCX2728702.1 pentapeptide repeat-containing protein [Saccharopolyspora sp. NFXS83]